MNRNHSFNFNQKFNKTVSNSPQKNTYYQKILISNYIKSNNKISLNSSLNSNNRNERNELLKFKKKYKELLKENECLKLINNINKRSLSGNSKSLIRNFTNGNLMKKKINNCLNIKKKKNLSNKKNDIQYNNYMSNEINEKNKINKTNFNLAQLLLNFLNQMKDLQENISKKSIDIYERKKKFEVKKKELKKICENIIYNNSINNTQRSKFIFQTPEKEFMNNNKFEDLINKLTEELKLKEEKVNYEINKNKNLIEKNENLNIQIKELNSLIISQKETIDGLNLINEEKKKKIEHNEFLEKNVNENLLKENNELKKIINEKENKINELLIQLQLNSNNDKIEKIKNLENEISKLNNEIINYKLKISQFNKDLISLSKKKDNLNINDFSNNFNLEEIKRKLENYKEKNNELNIENRQLKNKIAEIKTKFIAKDDDLINLKKDLILFNIETDNKINLIKSENEKSLNYKKDNSNHFIINNEVINQLNSNLSIYSKYIDLIKDINKQF